MERADKLGGELRTEVELLNSFRHPGVRSDLNDLGLTLDRVCQRYADVYSELRRIEPLFALLHQKLTSHLDVLETILFPEVLYICRAGRSLGAVTGPAQVSMFACRHLLEVAARLERLAEPGRRPPSLESALEQLRLSMARVQELLKEQSKSLLPRTIQLEQLTPLARVSSSRE